MVIFFSSAQSVDFNQFFCIQTVSSVKTYRIICWKNTIYRCSTNRACT